MFGRDTAVEAVQKAMVMISAGAQDVYITDPERGRIYRATSFPSLEILVAAVLRRCHTYSCEWNCAASPLILHCMADHSHLDDATYWCTRAKEMRALAQQADASHKDFLLGMAKEYERLAERVNELARFARDTALPHKQSWRPTR